MLPLDAIESNKFLLIHQLTHPVTPSKEPKLLFFCASSECLKMLSQKPNDAKRLLTPHTRQSLLPDAFSGEVYTDDSAQIMHQTTCQPTLFE